MKEQAKAAALWRAGARRRFETAKAEAADGGWQIRLDDLVLATPAGRRLLVPGRALAHAIAGEWNALSDKIEPARLGLTALANTAVDIIAPAKESICAQMLTWLDGDLLCYRAAWPESLKELQAKHWDPPLRRLESRLGSRFLVQEGLLPESQPQELRNGVAALLADCDAWRLAGLRALAGAAHSLALALAHLACDWPIDAVIAAALLDETYQAERWGRDREAEARRAAIAAEMRNAARYLRLLNEA